jgi:hypothetical protein
MDCRENTDGGQTIANRRSDLNLGILRKKHLQALPHDQVVLY